MDKYAVISLKKKGVSNRQIEKDLQINRKTIARIWNSYKEAEKFLLSSPDSPSSEPKESMDKLLHLSYDSSTRTRRKLTPSVQQRILQILDGEDKKTSLLGSSHKQKLSTKQVLEILHSEGIDIGHSSVNTFLREFRQSRQVFIRQEYSYGERLEYDFGEVKLVINGQVRVYYLAVLAAPASGFRWAYLYLTQNQKVFLDSHVQFFEMVKGSYKEVVYDNMRNVVTKFLGRHEKKLNDQLLNLAIYYGFDINVTNCFSGNEKGFVEGSVKKIRNFVFAKQYMFPTLEQAQKYLHQQLLELNKESKIEEEKKQLLPYRPMYELAEIEEAVVNKYSCVRIENNFYSVPDYLMAKKVTIKKYLDTILIYSHQEFVCEHKKIDGYGGYQLILLHYLNTLRKKPGALKHSSVLKKYPELKSIYQEYYKRKPKEFIELLIRHKEKKMEEILIELKAGPIENIEIRSTLNEEITEHSQSQLQKINQLYGIGENTYGMH